MIIKQLLIQGCSTQWHGSISKAWLLTANKKKTPSKILIKMQLIAKTANGKTARCFREVFTAG